MDTVLEFLNQKRDALSTQLKEVETELKNWKEFLESKNLDLGSSNKKESGFAISNNNTYLENITEIIEKTDTEMYTSEITSILKPYYPNLDRDSLRRTVTVELSDASRSGDVYSISREAKNEHHLAKAWGLKRFKDNNGNVKDQHKYKSTP